MSALLNLPEALLARGEEYIRLGRDREALQLFHKLLRFGRLPAAVAITAQVQLARLYLRRQKYAAARRQMQSALARRPACAEFHHLMATILDEDSDGDPDRALAHYRRAVELDPDNPAYHHDCGLCLLALGATAEGLSHLARAAALAPDELGYARSLAFGHLDSEQPTAARRTALAALFRRPGDSEARKLWADVLFHIARRRQQSQRGEPVAPGPRAVLLPFLRLQDRPPRKPRDAAAKVVRIDPASPPPSPHLPRPVRRRQSQ
jgi:tetratricopeptide (TPR) repeat protein